MTDRNAQPMKATGGPPRRTPVSRRLLVALHVLLAVLFATVVAWQVAQFLE